MNAQPNVSDLPTSTEVLVVGAGPTGITLAMALLQLDVDVTIVDTSAGIRTESRAVGVQSRTLEELARLGIAGTFVESGLQGEGFVASNRDETLLEIPFTNLDTPYPFVLLLPQSESERVLRDALQSIGGQVLRQHRALDHKDEHDSVTTIVSDPQGNVHSIRARYLVGCDGEHSGVRSRTGIDFSGDADAQDYLLADVRIDAQPKPYQVNFTFSPDGLLLLSPLREDIMRVVATVREPTLDYGREEIQQLLDQRSKRGTAPHITDIVELSSYEVSTRLAGTFRSGHIFLAGDAGHVHSPAGGQGMNTGIQDAVNLSWKLAACLKDGADEALLDTYEAERRPNAAALLSFTEQLTSLAELDEPTAMKLRNQVMHAIGGVEQVPPFLANRFSQLDVQYGSGDDNHRLVGRRIAPTGDQPTTLAWSLLVPENQRASADSLAKDFPVTVGVSPNSSAILVRPDGYVAAVRDEPIEEAGLRSLLQQRTETLISS